MPPVVKQQRPPLPVDHANPQIRNIDLSKPPPVKFQEIVRDEQITIVGRLKINTPLGHAFILRRLDTGAISLTTMFRAAFPTANEDAEKAEAAWVKANFDIAGANKAGRSRFAGTWVSPEVAVTLAADYNLSAVISALAKAQPDPNVVYRRSSKTQQPTPGASPAARPVAVSPSPREAGPAPAKRRREASPAKSVSTESGVTLAALADSTVSASPTVAAKAPAPTPPPSVARAVRSPTPRRSARLHDTGTSFVQSPIVPKSPRSTRSAKKTLTPTGSEDTVVDEEGANVARLATDTMEDDIQEQKELIARLKAEREQQEVEQAEKANGDTEGAEGIDADMHDEMSGSELAEEAKGQKRPRDESPLKFNFSQSQEEVGERVIATNRRVGLLGNIPPERKSFAFGSIAFAAGFGLMSLLPTIQTYLSF
ncbi:uncharacterized protein FIBRA_02127 [Fibroporia radiculosa]|uniref:HTH APSES-type domain-containing protein n=1 Tax=Fibroporia radiculosa TaxID=599839 RepID=J4GMH2_9APHY|nr:uncharacterized protein FIBRA_02127 [Fibroporia radiculosa]CCM00100.1 predicted protein [Fibroporia radiculosa]